MTTLSYSPGMVFQKTEKWHCGEITVTPRLLKILAAVDGRNTLAAIADKHTLSFEQVIREIQRLERLDLVRGSLHQGSSGKMKAPRGYLEPDYDLMVQL